MAKNDIFDFVYMQRLREKKKITQVRLSTKVGVSHQSIACYETNQRIPSLPVAYKIAKALDTSINGLFSDDIINKYYELPEEDKDSQIYCLGSKCKISKCRRRFQLLESTRPPNEG